MDAQSYSQLGKKTRMAGRINRCLSPRNPCKGLIFALFSILDVGMKAENAFDPSVPLAQGDAVLEGKGSQMLRRVHS